jgi:PAS domain S-box-containing protein
MNDTLESLFNTGYMPHGHCYLWKPDILWLNVISDSMIAFAYFSIPVILYYFVKKRPELEFKGIFILFSAFILLCGLTHVVSIFVIWHGAYGVHGLFKLATAVVSCITAYKLFSIIPDALKIPTPSAMKEVLELAHKEKLERLTAESHLSVQEAIKESENTLRSIFNSLPIGLHMFDLKGDELLFAGYNKAAVKILGEAHTKHVGETIEAAFPDVAGKKIVDTYKSIAANGGEWKDETVHYDDTEVSGVYRVQCFQGKHNSAIVLFDDVTQAHKQDLAIKQKDSFINAAFNAAITAVYIFDLQNKRIEYLNQTFSEQTGYTLDDFQDANADSLLSLVHPEHLSDLKVFLSKIINEHKDINHEHIEFQMRHLNGDYVWCLAKYLILERDAEGKASKLMGSFLNIDSQKAMQFKLVKLKNDAEQANETKTNFLANVSHEVRTPMNAILGLISLTLKMDLGDKQREHLERMEVSSKALLQILNDILDFSKLEAGKFSISNKAFDLQKLLDMATGIHSLVAKDKGLFLNTRISSTLHSHYIGDPLRINQVLNNLIGNAVKFTIEGGVTLNVSSNFQNGIEYVCFEVRDTGLGIASKDIDKLFDSFHQVDNSSMRSYGGTGLGLAISQSLCALMAGEISVESELGKGSIFTVCLPLQPAKSEDVRDDEPNKNHQQVIQSLSGNHILLVEDNETNKIVAEEMLAMLGISSVHAKNGEEAIVAFQNEHFDLILMDLQMPILDGYSAASTILEMAQQNDRDIPILAMSAAVLESAHDKVKNAGMLDHISKPIDIEILHGKLSTYLSWKSNARLTSATHAMSRLNQKGIDAEQSTFTQKLQHFDIDAALGRMAGNFILFKQLLASFLHDHKESIQNLESAAEAHDFELTQSIAHTIKGAAGTVGASAVQREALKVETAVEKAQPFEIKALTDEIAIALQEIERILDDLADATDSNRRPLLAEMPAHEKERYIETLLDTLRSGAFLSELDLEEQFPYIETCLNDDQFKSLKGHVRYLEYDKATELLNNAITNL